MPPDPPPRFAEFYRTELHRVLVFLYKQGATWDDAWDAAQEAFLAAMTHWDRIANPGAWVRTTALREHVHRRRRAGEELRRAMSTVEWLPRPKFTDLDLGVEQHAVLDAIASLPDRQREVMAWRYDGYPPNEIAELLGIADDAVRASLYQARRRLKTLLDGKIDRRRPEGGVE